MKERERERERGIRGVYLSLPPTRHDSREEYEVPLISFKTIFVQTLGNSVCYCYTSYEVTGQFFMITGSNEQLLPELEYTLLKPDCHSCWISKMQSGREDRLQERYALKFCLKFGKNATETYGILQTVFGASCMNRASVFECHKRFKEGRESVREDNRCARSKEVNKPELIGQRFRVRLRVTMLRF